MPLPILSAVKELAGPARVGLDRASGPSAPLTAPAPVWAWLVVVVGRAKGQTIPIRAPRFVIGRDPSCQLRPYNPTISRYHTALEFRGGRVFVQDLGGANGTVLNGRALRGESAEAPDGARLRVGPLRFVVRAGDGSEDVVAMGVSEGDRRVADGGGVADPRAAAPAEPDDPSAVHEDWLASLLSDGGGADPRAATLLEVGPAPARPAEDDPWGGDDGLLASVFSPDGDTTPAPVDDRDDRPAPAPSIELDEGWLASLLSDSDSDADADPCAATLPESAPSASGTDAAISLDDVEEAWLASAFLPVDDPTAPAPAFATDEPAGVDADWLASLLSDADADVDPRAATLLESAPAPAPPDADDPWGGDGGWLASALSIDDDTVAVEPFPSVNLNGEGQTGDAPVVRDLDGSARRLEEWIMSTLDCVESPSAEREPYRKGDLPMVARAHPLKDRLANREPKDLGQNRIRVIESRGVTVVLLLHREILTEKDSEETESELRKLVSAGLTFIVLDFDQVERCSSQFLGSVARLSAACKAEGGLLKACSLRPELIELISFSRLTRSLRVDPDQPTAFASAWPDRPATPLVVEVLSAVKGLGDSRAAGPGHRDIPAAPRFPHAPAPVQPRLLVATGKAEGQLIPLKIPRFVIGRDPSCQLRPRSPTINRFHAALEVEGGRVYVRDLGGTNGTVLNGRILRGEVAEAPDGARLRVGPLRFVVRAGSDDLVAPWLREGDGRGPGDGGRAGSRAAAPPAPAPDVSMTEVETGVSDVECKVIQGILVVTVKLPALADESAVGQLREALTRVSQRTPIRRVVISLCNVAVLSRPAMGMLVAHMLRLEWEGGGLRLCHILTPVMAVLKKIHLPLLVETHQSLDDAVLTSWT